MSEHWKSTPKYYCKHCLTYVRDTKLERANHEATGKHQGAVRRALTNLHRTANNETRERDRAKREIDRLNGVVSTNNNHNNAHGGRKDGGAGGRGGGKDNDNESKERARQAEQLAALGVALPSQLRGELAMPGEWSVTSTTIVVEPAEAEAEDESKVSADAASSRGVHKRERTEEQREHEEAVKGLFKKPRRWGRDARGLAEGSDELDALLSGGLAVKKAGGEDEKEDEEEEGKHVKEEVDERGVRQPDDRAAVKREPESDGDFVPAETPAEEGKASTLSDIFGGPDIKTEDGEEPAPAADLPAVAFKKRKAKNIRQR